MHTFFFSLVCQLSPHISQNETMVAEKELWQSGAIVKPCITGVNGSNEQTYSLVPLYKDIDSLCYEDGVGLNKAVGNFGGIQTPVVSS